MAAPDDSLGADARLYAAGFGNAQPGQPFTQLVATSFAETQGALQDAVLAWQLNILSIENALAVVMPRATRIDTLEQAHAHMQMRVGEAAQRQHSVSSTIRIQTNDNATMPLNRMDLLRDFPDSLFASEVNRPNAAFDYASQTLHLAEPSSVELAALLTFMATGRLNMDHFTTKATQERLLRKFAFYQVMFPQVSVSQLKLRTVRPPTLQIGHNRRLRNALAPEPPAVVDDKALAIITLLEDGKARFEQSVETVTSQLEQHWDATMRLYNLVHQQERQTAARDELRAITLQPIGPSVKFDVGGEIFQLSQATLDRFPRSLFAHLVDSKRWGLGPDGTHFFDRTPTNYFKAMVTYLITGQLVLTPHLSKEALLMEFDFWLVDPPSSLRLHAAGTGDFLYSVALPLWQGNFAITPTDEILCRQDTDLQLLTNPRVLLPIAVPAYCHNAYSRWGNDAMAIRRLPAGGFQIYLLTQISQNLLRVGIFDHLGIFIRQWDLRIALKATDNILHMEIGPDGNVYVGTSIKRDIHYPSTRHDFTDTRTGLVNSETTALAFKATPTLDQIAPHMQRETNQHLYQILVLDAQGQMLRTWQMGVQLNTFCLGLHDEVFVVQSRAAVADTQVYVYTTAGVPKRTWTCNIQHLSGMTVAPLGELYLGSLKANECRVQVYTPLGLFARTAYKCNVAEPDNPEIIALAVDHRNKRLYVGSSQTKTVQVVDICGLCQAGPNGFCTCVE